MQGALGQLGVVENRPGASGSLGLAAVAQSAPDGGTIGVVNTANLCMNPFLFANTGYDPQRDFAPLCVMARLMNALTVSAESGMRTLQDLLARSKSRPGGLAYSSSGAGSSPHLAAELLKHRTGMQGEHVPYRGSAPALNDTVAGTVQVMLDQLPSAIGQIRAGTVRVLAVTGPRRSRLLPEEVPTVAEIGLPDAEATS